MAPLAVKTVDEPAHIAGLLTATVGDALTVTVAVFTELQPVLVPVTV